MTRAFVVLLWTAACLANDPVTGDEVIPALRVLGNSDSLVADGHTPVMIEICTAPGNLDPKLTATLRSSAGAWQVADTDPKTATVAMSHTCEDRALTPDAAPGTFSVAATIGTFTKVIAVTLSMPALDRVRLGRAGALSATAASMLTITATLDATGGGLPSIGTAVQFAVTVDAPPGGTAYFGQPEVKIATGSSADAALFVSPGVTKLTVSATATPAGRRSTASDPLDVSM